MCVCVCVCVCVCLSGVMINCFVLRIDYHACAWCDDRVLSGTD